LVRLISGNNLSIVEKDTTIIVHRHSDDTSLKVVVVRPFDNSSEVMMKGEDVIKKDLSQSGLPQHSREVTVEAGSLARRC
jgi:hypothetical protein